MLGSPRQRWALGVAWVGRGGCGRSRETSKGQCAEAHIGVPQEVTTGDGLQVLLVGIHVAVPLNLGESQGRVSDWSRFSRTLATTVQAAIDAVSASAEIALGGVETSCWAAIVCFR